MNTKVPTGRATKASGKIVNDHNTPCSGLAKGKKNFGNTRTEAMA